MHGPLRAVALKKGRRPSTGFSAKSVKKWAFLSWIRLSSESYSRPSRMAGPRAMATSLSSWRARHLTRRILVPTSMRFGGSTHSLPTWLSARITSRTSRDSCETQPFSEALEWRERDYGTEARALGRRRPERLLPGRGPRGARRRCDHPARQQDGRPLRTPRPADPLHPGLASAGDEALQGIWRRVAAALRPRDEGRAVPSGPRSSDGRADPLERDGSGAGLLLRIPGVHGPGTGSRVDAARARGESAVHLRPRDGLLRASDDARRPPTRLDGPSPPRCDSRGGPEAG